MPKSRQKHIEVKGAGHYGIFSGRRWREIVYPQVRDFIRLHNVGPQVRAANAAAKKARRPTAAA